MNTVDLRYYLCSQFHFLILVLYFFMLSLMNLFGTSWNLFLSEVIVNFPYCSGMLHFVCTGVSEVLNTFEINVSMRCRMPVALPTTQASVLRYCLGSPDQKSMKVMS